MSIDIERLKSGLDIVEVVGSYIDLKRSGSEYQACCPFHDEKTPSFSVVPNKGFYHCFGCGAHGDVIDFVAEYTGVSFKEAAEALGGADRLPAGDAPVKKQVERFDPYVEYVPLNIPEQLNLDAGGSFRVTNPKRDHKQWTCRPVAVHQYGDHGYVVRIEIDGKKLTPMIRWCRHKSGREGWVMFPFDEPRPLYGSELLERYPGKQVLIVEGEKCKDYLAANTDSRLVIISWSGGTNGWAKSDWSALSGRNVVVWPDNDEPGMACAKKLGKHLSSVGAKSVRYVLPDPELPDGWDCADRKWSSPDEVIKYCKQHVVDSLDTAVAKEEKPEPEPSKPPKKIDPDEWRGLLMFKDDGVTIQSNINNAHILCAYHPDMAGVVKYNEFGQTVDIVAAPPWDSSGEFPRELSDVDDTRATAWLERHGVKMTIGNTHNVLVSVASLNPYNPLQEYLNGLEWDGVSRIETALTAFFGCEDNEYTRSVSRRFLIGSVARALQPGCKMDTMLILEGPQGLKKSTAIAELYGDEWFTDELSDFGSKDAAMQVQGVWAIEVAELSTMNRAEAARVKEWITRRVERFRPPYGRNIIKAPRQCVLVGTVNPEGGYLKDATGGRRFWPVQCHEIDIAGIRKHRDQLWAEAVYQYEKGERWWFDYSERHIAEHEQQKRYESDAWEEDVLKYTNGMDQITVNELLDDCLGLKPRDQNQITQNRVAKILVSDGFERRQRRIEGRRQWVYYRVIKE